MSLTLSSLSSIPGRSLHSSGVPDSGPTSLVGSFPEVILSFTHSLVNGMSICPRDRSAPSSGSASSASRFPMT